MKRRRRTPPADDPRQLSVLAPDAAAFVHLVRENLRLLGELAPRFEVGHLVPWSAGTAADGATTDRPAIRCPADVAGYLGPELSTLQQEQLRVVLLDTQHRALGVSLVYQGGLNTTPVAGLADVFREAVRIGAQAIVLVHNHPSGDAAPSPEDVRVTADAGRAGELLGIEVLDHIILGRGCHVSLRQQGLYAPPGESPDAPRASAPSGTAAPPSPPSPSAAPGGNATAERRH